MSSRRIIVSVASLLASSAALAGTASPSYVQAISARVGDLSPIMTAGEEYNGHTFVGLPDGLGACDLGNGAFRLLINHEFKKPEGAVHARGATGGFVADWIIAFTPSGDDLFAFAPQSGNDPIQSVMDYDDTTGNYAEIAAGQFYRPCSAYLAGPRSGFDGWWIFDVQAHHSLPSPLVEGGPILAMHVGLIAGDLNDDGHVGATDLAIFLGLWGSSGPDGDLDGDGSVGPADLAMLLGAWTD